MKTLFILLLAMVSITSIAKESKKKAPIENQFVNTKWKCISDDLKEIEFENVVQDNRSGRETIHPGKSLLKGTIVTSHYRKTFGIEDIQFSFYCSFYDKDSIFIDGMTIEDQLIFRGKYTFLSKDIIIVEGYEVTDKDISNIYDVKVARKNFTLIREK